MVVHHFSWLYLFLHLPAEWVSRSMLSEIEREKANPTLTVTFRIARAFGLTLQELIESAEASASKIQVIRANEGSGTRWLLREIRPPISGTPERCQSGRSGRSRKPLCVQAYRGFESHPLRQFQPSYLQDENFVSLSIASEKSQPSCIHTSLLPEAWVGITGERSRRAAVSSRAWMN